MITVKVILPPDVDSTIIDVIDVTVQDSTVDRQPRRTYLEGVTREVDRTLLTFTT